jgi:hypothetical protein
MLYCEATAHTALSTAGILPDLVSSSKDIDYVHRRTAHADIYFVRNTQSKALETAITFRVANLQPEIFNAVTGEIMPVMLFEQTDDGRTQMHFSLKPYGSFFIIFEKHAPHTHLVRLEKDHQEVALSEDLTVTEHSGQLELRTDQPGSYQAFFANGKTMSIDVSQTNPVQLASGWTLDFPPKWGAPAHTNVLELKSWTDFDDSGIRYFSGTAVYHTIIHVNSDQLGTGHELWLNLGEVHEIAQIRINGVSLTPLWMSPFADRVDKLLHPGDNHVDVEVTNFWPNRIIGDLQPGNGPHYTSTNIRAFKKSSPLLPSGLLGPVVLRQILVMPLTAH